MIEKRAVLYARVSTDDQRSNFSIPTQIAECMTYCQQRGYAVIGNVFVNKETGLDCQKDDHSVPAFVDDYSSRELNRPGLDATLSFLEEYGFDVVVVHSIDRLARDPYIRQSLEREFLRRGAKVEFALGSYEDTPEGEVRKDLDSTFAKWENLKRVERCNRGKRGKAEKGLFVGGRTPYGYTLDSKGFGGVSIHPEQSKVVQMIFHLYAEENYSFRMLERHLRKLGIPSYTGKPIWHLSAIRNILQNTAYIGYLFYNKSFCRSNSDRKPREEKEWIRIEVPPLVDQRVFDLVQMRIKEHRETLRRQPQHFYLLSGMLRCAECGRPYRSNFKNDRPKEHRKAYSSYQHRKQDGHCANREITAHRIERLVWEQVSALLTDPDMLRKGYEASLEIEQSNKSHARLLLEEFYRAASKLDQQQANLMRAYLDPDIHMSKTQFLAQKSQFDSELNGIQSRIEELEPQINKLPTPTQFRDIEQFAQRIQEKISNPDWEPSPESKRRLLELLHIRVLVSLNGTAKVIGWFGETDSFSYKPYSRSGRQGPKRGCSRTAPRSHPGKGWG